MGSTWRSKALCSLCFALLWALPAYAAPGDPRFLQGTVEWPAVLTGEPIVIVRGDDGHVYSADLDGARRQGAEVVRVGGRVALLVLEGTRPHDVTAIVIAAGDAVSLSRALAQRALPPVAAASTTPAPAVAAVVPVAAVAPAVVPAPPASTPPVPAPAATAPAPPAAAVTPPPVPAPQPSVVAATPPPPAPAPAPAVTTPTTVVVTPPPAPVPTPAAATTPAAAPAPPAATRSAPPAPPAVVPSPAPGSPGKATGPSGVRQQWARVDGRVQSVDGALLVLRADNGSLVMVDISQINPNVSSALRRERLVSVYGYPLEQKFEAAGYIELDPSHPEPPRLRHR
jgi:hypothetical protein